MFLPCFFFAALYIFQRFIKSQRGFSIAGAGAGYTFYPLSNETNQEKNEFEEIIQKSRLDKPSKELFPIQVATQLPLPN